MDCAEVKRGFLAPAKPGGNPLDAGRDDSVFDPDLSLEVEDTCR